MRPIFVPTQLIIGKIGTLSRKMLNLPTAPPLFNLNSVHF